MTNDEKTRERAYEELFAEIIISDLRKNKDLWEFNSHSLSRKLHDSIVSVGDDGKVYFKKTCDEFSSFSLNLSFETVRKFKSEVSIIIKQEIIRRMDTTLDINAKVEEKMIELTAIVEPNNRTTLSERLEDIGPFSETTPPTLLTMWNKLYASQCNLYNTYLRVIAESESMESPAES